MPSFHKALLAAGAAISVLGAVLLLRVPPTFTGPPVLSEPSPSAAAPGRDPFPSVETLAAPWYRPAPPAAPAPAKTPPPGPPARVDANSISFLGSSQDLEGTPTFFFKFNVNGQVITLKLGETKRGWTLKSMTDQKFTLAGSGGLYEVSR